MKMCVELGLHRRRRSNAVSLKSELNKRLFWACYWHDREIAIAMGRPPSISDHDIDVEVRQFIAPSRHSLKSTVTTWRRRSDPRFGRATQSFSPGSNETGLPTDDYDYHRPSVKAEKDWVWNSAQNLSCRQVENHESYMCNNGSLPRKTAIMERSDPTSKQTIWPLELYDSDWK